MRHGSVAQSCLPLCDPTDCRLRGSSVHWIFQARILEWVAIFLLQGIFPTQELSMCLLCLLHCRQILYLQRQNQRNPNFWHVKVFLFLGFFFFAFVDLCSVQLRSSRLKLVALMVKIFQALVVKNLPANAGDVRGAGLIPEWERSPGEEHGDPLQSSCLENPKDRGAWRATVHTVAKSQP